MNRDFIGALLQLNAEKGVPQDILIQTLEQAIESAYRRNADAPEMLAAVRPTFNLAVDTARVIAQHNELELGRGNASAQQAGAVEDDD